MSKVDKAQARDLSERSFKKSYLFLKNRFIYGLKRVVVSVKLSVTNAVDKIDTALLFLLQKMCLICWRQENLAMV